MKHRHTTLREGEPQPMDGMCDCPGCHAAFARVTEYCSCGATRTRCAGIGRASDATHRGNGFYCWEENDNDRNTNYTD